MLPYPVHSFTPSRPPAALWQLLKPPAELWIQGLPSALALLERLPSQGLAVVGTRRPQARSLSFLKARVEELSGSGLILLSGLAHGIDSAAHEGALRAGLPTIAVLGGALDDIYPRDNLELARAILETGGLLVTETPPGTPIERHFFLRRNRLIAGWAAATWIVEAGHRSGALNTACWARDNGKDCYATPCYPGDAPLAGNQRLLAADGVIPLWETHDLGHTWSELKSLPGPRKRRRAGATPSLPEGDEGDLARAVGALTGARGGVRGGVRVEELLDWALGCDWAPARFFSALDGAIRTRLIDDHDGILGLACSSGPLRKS